ncbi:hypothetical protein LTR62_007346 [Meristemomyces frigidus]|uniref:KOW domain-containing protein n=1 Tax=Meristemomyces frigidus TaxID=1508187 RepID=A0AAN7TVE4_9PEZI|nr:hypothetical protein LTR62_007346 [Meristemomyces frigidus]
MDRVLQRTVRAVRSTNRKRAKLQDHEQKGQSWSNFQQRNRLVRANGANIKAARLNRATDWAAGRLAPRRDVGEQAETYGALPIYDIQSPTLNAKDIPKWFPIVEGDRVVVMTGRDRGKIGEVTEVLKDRGQLRVKGANVVDVIVPKWMTREEEQGGQQLSAVPRPMSINDVRLVYPLPDPTTGIPRDVIIDRLINANWAYDKLKREWTQGDRVIPGTNTIIPWPETIEDEPEDYDIDTLRNTVEIETFRPWLLAPPMPLSVIDELRGKYSRFRTRHEHEYLEKKGAEDAKVERRKGLIAGMRTPLQELGEARRRKREVEERELSEGQLAAIGRVIAGEQARAVGSLRGPRSV